MPPRTSLFNQLPWVGGVNTSLDEALIPPNQLTRADNVVFDTRGSKKKRPGIDYSWDNQTESDVSIYGLHEFWFGIDARVRRFVSINEAGVIRSYLPSGSATVLTIEGKIWANATDEISMLTFNNRLIMAVSGADNLVKIWEGSGNVIDLKNLYGQSIQGSGRSSLGTTRTLVLNAAFKGIAGDYIIISNASGANAAFYNGTYKVDSISTTNVSNDTIVFTGVGALTEAGTADASLVLDGAAPQASILREHQGRIWTNDKTNKDRVHYSSPFNHLEWLGFGDSGAIDIGVGDGDPDGITAIFPTFKGDLFVAKRTKLYRITGTSPENFSISLVSSGIGCVSHGALTLVDQDDLFFVSEKGIHSIGAVSAYGDFSAKFISADIQKTFIENFPKARLKYTKAAYNPEINSVAFAFTDANQADTDVTNLESNNCIWLYNILFNAWYRWSDVSCQALVSGNDGDKKRFYLGTNQNRIAKAMINAVYDYNYDGDRVAVTMVVHTGQLTLDNQLYTDKGLKRFLLYYKAETTHSINVKAYADNKALATANNLTFSTSPPGDLLGESFVLGESMLGSVNKLQSNTRMIDGFGRSVKIEMTFAGINDRAEIQGFGVEFEPAGTVPEVA